MSAISKDDDIRSLYGQIVRNLDVSFEYKIQIKQL